MCYWSHSWAAGQDSTRVTLHDSSLPDQRRPLYPFN